MEKLITIAVFDNSFEVSFNLLKDMLEEGGIPYLVCNEYSRAIKPTPAILPCDQAIQVKVYEKDFREAFEIAKTLR
jgi:hypothetical protein